MDTHLLRPQEQDRYVEMIHQGGVDVVEARAQELGPDMVRKLLKKAIVRGAVAVRHAAYRIGLKQFGPEFARPALKDLAGSVRNWAAKALSSSAPNKARPLS